jgi:hypothetical protein
MRGINRTKVGATVAIAAVLATGYIGVAYAAPSGPASPTDTTPAPDPAPDPAPPAPKPKPAPKPAAKPAPRPAPVYRAPVTSAPRSTYTSPARVTTHAKPNVVHHRAHKRHKKSVKQVAPTPKPKPQVKDASVVKSSGLTATVATNQADAVRRAFVISGIGLAALMFLLVVSVPATAMRFTAAGRVVMDHQTDLVLTGIALLALTALLFAVTGTGS